MKKKVGFFGGTFDPIHLGHLNLGLALLESQALDEVLFCPTALSPHKVSELPPIDKEHRKKMVELAIEPIEKFKLIENELHQRGPTYTVNTIQELLAEDASREIHLLLGEDSLEGLDSWKEIETLLLLAPPLIGRRPRQLKNLSGYFPPDLLRLIEEGQVTTPILEISSSHIRRRLAEKKYCGYLLPAKVLDYIYEHHLYY